MKFFIIPVTPLQQNCTLLCCNETHRAAVIDPGGEVDRIIAAAEKEGVEIEKILLTHGHLDHVGGAGELAQRLQIPIEGPHREDQFWIEALPQQCAHYAMPVVNAFVPDRWLVQGDTIHFGNTELQVLHCPGHTPGHVVFYHAGEQLAQVGDVLFKGSIGRTDFPRSDHALLLSSIRERLWPLGDEVRFIPGHGPMSTLGAERRDNPFVGDGV